MHVLSTPEVCDARMMHNEIKAGPKKELYSLINKVITYPSLGAGANK